MAARAAPIIQKVRTIEQQEEADVKTDVIVVGAGLAGMCAAISAQAEGAAVCVVDRSAVGTGTNSAISNGVFTAPTAAFPDRDFIRETLQAGKAINHMPIVQTVARKGAGAMRFLRFLGLELIEGHDNYTVVPSRPDVIRGVPMVQLLADHLRSLPRVTLLTGFYVTALLRQADRVVGIQGFDRSGQNRSLV
ncbi:MAG: FAD-dependent oxidoreductase, partial [Desulfobacterales bacterium]|nr:FAD-dependent oxidoreductase [Desulfobacterales bacterium]